MKRYMFLLFPCLIFAKSTDFDYKEMKCDVVVEVKVKVEETDKGLKITSDSAERSLEEELSPAFEYKKYVFTSKIGKGVYSLTLEGKKVVAKGKTDKGDEKEVSFTIDKRPWVQSFDYGLRSLLTSDNSEYTFFIVNPDDFSKNVLIAKKQGVEEIVVEGKTYQAQKVTITLPGFKGMFWSATAWFDEKTHEYLKYTGNEGPNTPTTVITLVPKHENKKHP